MKVLLNLAPRNEKSSNTDESKIKQFLKNNTIECKVFKAKISKEQCKHNQTLATVSLQKRVDGEAKNVKQTVSGCKDCVHYDRVVATRDTSISKNGYRTIKKDQQPKEITVINDREI